MKLGFTLNCRQTAILTTNHHSLVKHTSEKQTGKQTTHKLTQLKKKARERERERDIAKHGSVSIVPTDFNEHSGSQGKLGL